MKKLSIESISPFWIYSVSKGKATAGKFDINNGDSPLTNYISIELKSSL